MSEHTPGPWRANIARTGPDLYPTVFGPTGSFVADTWHYQLDEGEMVANANIIAAAPDLLAACEAILEDYLGHAYCCEQCNPEGDTAIQAARAAIATARGEVAG